MDEKTREEFLDNQLEIVRRDRSEWRLKAQQLQVENDRFRAIIALAQKALRVTEDV